MKKETFETWIARDEDNSLCLYLCPPVKTNNVWSGADCLYLDKDLFPNVTWEDKKPTKIFATLNTEDFNKAINEFVAWYVGQESSKEDFDVRLNKRKKEIVDGIKGFKEKIKSLPMEDNPFVPLVLMLMMFPSMCDFNDFFEKFIGKKLSDDEVKEYIDLSKKEADLNNIIKFLEESKKVDESVISPVLNSLFNSKDIVLSYFKELKENTRNKLNELIKK